MKVLRLLTACLLLAFPAGAWSTATNQRIASKAAQLGPPDLRFLIEKYRPEYHSGLDSALPCEGSRSHVYLVNRRSGLLRTQLEHEINGAVEMIRQRKPMRDFIEKLGVIAHLVSDANNPFHVDDADPRLEASHADFEAYVDRKLGSFPTVFYGLDTGLQPGPYLDSIFQRSAAFYPLLSEEYFRSGQRRSSTDFDDRSTAFGVASLSYSHAVTDLVNIYYYVWRSAGGDVRTQTVMKRGNLLLNEAVFGDSVFRPGSSELGRSRKQ